MTIALALPSPTPRYRTEPRCYRLNKGDTVVASCIGAPLPVVKYMDSWTNDISVTEGKYIDPTITPSPAA
jgi:hypothetical protein